MLKYNMDCVTVQRLEYVLPSDSAGQAFSLVSMGEFDCGDQYYTLRDGLPRGLLLYTLSGCGELQYKDTQVTLLPDSLAVINCANRQYYRTSPGRRWHFRWIHFAGDNALQLEDAINRDSLFVATLPASVFDGYWGDLYTAAQSTRVYSGHMTALYLHQVLVELMRQKEQQLFGGYTPQLSAVHAAAAFMELNFRKPLSIEDIARVVAMSKYHFIKVFAQIMGTTPYQYLTVLRIAEAKRLLATTDRPVSAVALCLGFSDSKTFIRSFKKTAGMTPLQFRKNSM